LEIEIPQVVAPQRSNVSVQGTFIWDQFIVCFHPSAMAAIWSAAKATLLTALLLMYCGAI